MARLDRDVEEYKQRKALWKEEGDFLFGVIESHRVRYEATLRELEDSENPDDPRVKTRTERARKKLDLLDLAGSWAESNTIEPDFFDQQAFTDLRGHRERVFKVAETLWMEENDAKAIRSLLASNLLDLELIRLNLNMLARMSQSHPRRSYGWLIATFLAAILWRVW